MVDTSRATCDHCGRSIELDVQDFPGQLGWYYGWYLSYDCEYCACPSCVHKYGGFGLLELKRQGVSQHEDY